MEIQKLHVILKMGLTSTDSNTDIAVNIIREHKELFIFHSIDIRGCIFLFFWLSIVNCQLSTVNIQKKNKTQVNSNVGNVSFVKIPEKMNTEQLNSAGLHNT